MQFLNGLYPALSSITSSFPSSLIIFEKPITQSFAWVQQYFPLITPTVGAYRLACGYVEANVYANVPSSETIIKVSRHSRCYLPPQTMFYLHGILFGCSGGANLAYSLEHYRLVSLPVPKEKLLPIAGGFFLASHLLSLIYYTQLYLCAKEASSQEPELCASLRVYAIKGIITALTAIISSAAAFLCPSGLVFFLLVGVACLTGCLNALSNYFSSFHV